eukprot:TRINITY_DN424_c0_g1_i2.p1 TRINITY_DN424_c0_g1~~TRINITY_DN424_c0_g1_i2.p1  ORF type:complete len:161 (-),score=7.94 TRINITY_DN424_c0_g1_i2:209-691(-)
MSFDHCGFFCFSFVLQTIFGCGRCRHLNDIASTRFLKRILLGELRRIGLEALDQRNHVVDRGKAGTIELGPEQLLADRHFKRSRSRALTVASHLHRLSKLFFDRPLQLQERQSTHAANPCATKSRRRNEMPAKKRAQRTHATHNSMLEHSNLGKVAVVAS